MGRSGLMLVAVMAVAPSWGATPQEEALVRAARRARPAVAHVEVDKGASWAPALRELLDDVGAEAPTGEEVVARATGSAVIVSASGRVLTNHHVVDGAPEVTLVLADQRRFRAVVVGTDAKTDVAVLRIDAPGPFPWLPLGDSDELAVGQPVLAVGSPFDFKSTVTLGIVSATGRRGLDEAEIQDYIQTDAAVNPGNSGGPLVDLQGRVVGINTAIYSQGAEQNSGISFAIPSNMAARVAAALEAGEHVSRARIGLVADDAEAVDGDPSRRGAEVGWVVPAGPAAQVGLRRGDVIVAVDGEAVASASALSDLVRAREVGSSLEVVVARDDARETLEVVVADARSIGAGPPDVGEGASWAGLVAVADTAEIRVRLGVAEGRGALVGRVVPGSEAARMGVLAGDRIVQVAGRSIADADELAGKLELLVLAPVVVALRRAGDDIVTVLPPP